MSDDGDHNDIVHHPCLWDEGGFKFAVIVVTSHFLACV
jgi:hypothetical protein